MVLRSFDGQLLAKRSVKATQTGSTTKEKEGLKNEKLDDGTVKNLAMLNSAQEDKHRSLFKNKISENQMTFFDD